LERFSIYSGYDLIRIIALAGIYALIAKLVLAFFADAQLVSIIWPPSGIALAILVLDGRKLWPGVLLGALLGNFWAGAAFLTAFCIGIGNTLEALCGFYLLQQLGNRLRKPEHYLYLLFAGSLASCVAALFGSVTLLSFNIISQQEWLDNALHWWMGDVLGIAILTPLIIVWRELPKLDWRSRQTWLAGLCLLVAFLAGQLIFLEWPFNLGHYGKGFYMFAFLACGVLNFGLHGTLLVISIVLLQSMFSVIFNVGYFANSNGEISLILQWSYLLVMSSVGIPMALAIQQHQRSEQIAKSISKFNQQILQSLQEGVAVYDKAGRIKLWNSYMETLTGIKQAECLDKLSIEVLPEVAKTPIPEGIQQALTGETLTHQPIMLSNNHWLSYVQMPLYDDKSKIIGVIELVKNVTQPIELAQSLSVSESSFQSILDNTPSVIYRKNLDGKYLLINRQFEKLFNIRNATWRGKNDFELLPTDIAKTVRQNDLQVLNSGRPHIFEENIPHLNGEIHTYLSHKFPLFDNQGNIYALCGISSDITELKQSAALLQESELRWKFALESGGDGVWDWDLVRDKVFLSPSCMTILGFTEQDRENNFRNWEKGIHEEDLTRLKADLQNHLNNHTQRFRNEHRIKLANQQWRWILTRGLVISRDSNGQPLRIIGTQTDITERKQQQWAQLSQIVDSSPEAMLLVAANGSIKLANTLATKIFAYPHPLLIDLNVDQLVPILLRANHAQNRAQFSHENTARPMNANRTLTALRQDGSEFPVEISLTPVEIDNQPLIIASIVDITERKSIEHEMQLMAMIYQAIGDAVMVTDADNRIIAINKTFSQLTGYSEQEAIGQYAKLLNSGQHSPDFFQSMWHALTLTGHWQGEICNRRKNGEIYHEWLVINTIYGSHNEVERRVGIFSEITAQKHVEQTIWRHANFDPLTDLANRRMFQDRLNHEIKKAHRQGNNLALMLLDLDRFKEVNDTLGHSIGDILLQETAKRILECVRTVDTVARLGGDEFTIILGGLDSNTHAEWVATAILQELAKPYCLDEELVYISASIGITFYPQDAVDAEQLIKNADQAMYTAKRQGRNCYSYFTVEIEQAAKNRMRMINDLRLALPNQELRVFYQPIVELSTGNINKAEALLRWRHPVQGMISPSEFIPLAEETGLIFEIGNWVFFEVVKQLSAWRTEFAADFKISINKSPLQFTRNDQNQCNWIAYLNTHGLSGDSIVIEITEGLLLDADTLVRQHLYAYRDAGIQVAIDDFGTGYSSLSYLKKFDIDFLKIDQSFTRNLAVDSSDLALCEAIIVMAHKLGLKVIAEGIETQQQLDLLFKAGCDYGQGYLFSRPLPADNFSRLLKTNMGKALPV